MPPPTERHGRAGHYARGSATVAGLHVRSNGLRDERLAQDFDPRLGVVYESVRRSPDVDSRWLRLVPQRDRPASYGSAYSQPPFVIGGGSVGVLRASRHRSRGGGGASDAEPGHRLSDEGYTISGAVERQLQREVFQSTLATVGYIGFAQRRSVQAARPQPGHAANAGRMERCVYSATRGATASARPQYAHSPGVFRR